MVNKCSAFGCTSGYKRKHDEATDPSVTFHAFPLHNKDLCDRWVKANPRKGFVPSKHSKLCSLHFHASDFLTERTDSNVSRRLSAVSELPVRRRLKPDAVPSIFANAPEYLSTPKAPPRTARKATSASRREHEALKMDALEELFCADDDISGLTLAEIQSKLQGETAIPDGYSITLKDSKLFVYLLDVTDSMPQVAASIAIHEDFSTVISVHRKLVSKSMYADLLTDGVVQQLSQLNNIMARVKSWSSDVSSMSLSLAVDMAVNALKAGLGSIGDEDSEEYKQTEFMVEQLQLLTKSKFGRHYSPGLTVTAFMVHSASSAAYDVLQKSSILCLPSVNTLKKVTKRLDTRSGLDNSAYLKLRISNLNEHERTVVLIIDEIYVAKRVEYSGGDVQGLAADGSVASTLLCFMVKSLACKYKDVVAIYPMCKLTAEKQHECFKETMKLLGSVGIRVVAVSVDNAATNRKFYVDCLCSGSLQTHFIDTATGQPIFLLFDPVHNMKNLYNNFQARKTFECPVMENNLPDGCCAKFADIAELYELESTMPLKKAYSLTQSTLDPKSIEKTSTKLALSVFCESTRDALHFYSTHECKDWKGTADFVSVVVKLWKVLNVKTRTKGKHKRDYAMDPVRSSSDWKLQFLREFANFLQLWQHSKKAGLTRETFLAIGHTCLSLADCAAYLLDKLGFSYVLLGHLQSDAIESRFGWLRQLSGANYFISMKQVLDSDKKIRALSLLKFSSLSVTDIDDAIQPDRAAVMDSAADTVADSVAEALTTNQHWPSSNDASIIYYVSGAIARSVVRCNKCEHCNEVLTCTDCTLEPLQFDDSSEYQASTFLDEINRGGLSRPSEYTFMSALHCWRVFTAIKSSSDLTAKFLSAASHRILFCKIMDRAMDGDTLLVEDNYCFNGHDLKTLIVRRFFNCIAKNLVRELTTKANQQSGNQSKKRKISKLQSQ